MNSFSPDQRCRAADHMIGLLSAVPLLALLATDLLTSQPLPEAHAAAKIIHLIAIIASSLIVLIFARSPWIAAAFIVLVLLLRLVGEDGVFRFAYLLALSFLFAAAGYCVVTYARVAFSKVIVALLGVAVLVGAAQLLGLHPGLYAWSAHGTLADGQRMLVTPTPTLFRGATELDTLSFVQSRPSSIFASNQLFTVFILFSAGFVLTMRGRIAKISAILVGLAAALSMSKAAILGVFALSALSLFFLPTNRNQSFLVLLSSIFCCFFYYILFPGTFVSMLNLQLVSTSFLLRTIGVMDALGFNQSWLGFFQGSQIIAQSVDDINKAGLLNQASPEIIGETDLLDQQKQERTADPGSNNKEIVQIIEDPEPQEHLSKNLVTPVTTFASALLHPYHSLFVAIIVITLSALGAKAAKARIRFDLVLLGAVLIMGATANLSDYLLYWHWAGFGASVIFMRAFCGWKASPLTATLARKLGDTQSVAHKRPSEVPR